MLCTRLMHGMQVHPEVEAKISAVYTTRSLEMLNMLAYFDKVGVVGM